MIKSLKNILLCFLLFYINSYGQKVHISKIITKIYSKNILDLEPEKSKEFFGVSFNQKTIALNQTDSSISQNFSTTSSDDLIQSIDVIFLKNSVSATFNYLHIALQDKNLTNHYNTILSLEKKLGKALTDTTYTTLSKSQYILHHEWEVQKPFRIMTIIKPAGYMGITLERAEQFYIEDEEYDG